MMRLMKDDLVTLVRPVDDRPVDAGSVVHRYRCIPILIYAQNLSSQTREYIQEFHSETRYDFT
jgi:hypothetical protein